MGNDAKAKILVVDDEKLNLNILADLLKPYYKVILAKSGEQAIQRAQSDPPPNLILLDVIMPEMDGYETCRRIKTSPLTSKIPVIFLTAKTEPEDVVKGFKIGAVDFVTKPFNSTELLARISTHLELNAGREIITKQNSEYKELLHVLCHDLKNPLGALKSCMDLFKEDPTLFGELQKIIDLSIKNGLEIIDQVRAMQVLAENSTDFQFSNINLKAAFEEAISILQHKFSEKNLDIQIDIDEAQTVWAEKTSLVNSVINNILTNAIKFSFIDGRIMIAARKKDNQIMTTIKDFGIGIPEKMVSDIFDVGKATSRKGTNGETGTGFGMPLVKKFITAYGGSIDINSTEKTEGSTEHGTEINILLNEV